MTVPGPARGFARRMGPAALLVALSVALGPPLVFSLVGRRLLADQAGVYAAHVAAGLRPLVLRQPRLWRYNAGKVVGAAARHRGLPDLASVRITDCAGATLFSPARLGVGSGATGGPAVRAPVGGHGGTVAWVAVRLDPGPLRRTRNLLALASGLLGLLLGGFVYLYPTRFVGRQAARLREGRAVVRIQEEERRRIARDLHDGLGQSLTALKLSLEAARPADGSLAAQLGTCGDALDELRRVVHDLRPPDLAAGGVEDALRAVTERFEVGSGIPVSFRVRLAAQPEEELAVVLLRVLQEALTNVGRHAGASEVGVALEGTAERLELTVTDDGRGFDADEAGGGAGLPGIRERVGFCGGSVEVRSGAGRGTRLTVRLPLG